ARDIQRQFEVFRSAAFYAKRAVTQTPDSLNDPEIRDFLHAAALRLMTEPLEERSNVPALAAASRQLLEGASAADAKPAETNLPALIDTSSPPLDFAPAFRNFMSMEIAMDALALFNAPVHHIVMDIEKGDPNERIH